MHRLTSPTEIMSLTRRMSSCCIHLLTGEAFLAASRYIQVPYVPPSASPWELIFTMQNKQIDMHLAGLTIKDFGIAVTLAVRVDVFPIETLSISTLAKRLFSATALDENSQGEL